MEYLEAALIPFGAGLEDIGSAWTCLRAVIQPLGAARESFEAVMILLGAVIVPLGAVIVPLGAGQTPFGATLEAL